MAKKGKQLWHADSELPIYTDIKNDTKSWEELEKAATETFNANHNGKAEKALSNKASGRRCPKCAHQLYVRDESDTGVIVLACWNCHSTWHNTDLEAVYELNEKGKPVIDSVTDGMYRYIPDTDVNAWMSFFERTKKKD